MNCVYKLCISVSSQIHYIWSITLKRHVLKRDLHIDSVPFKMWSMPET